MGNVVHITGQVVEGRYPYAVKEAKTGAFFLPFSVATYREEMRRDQSPISIPTYHRIIVYGNENFLRNKILPSLVVGVPVCISGEIRYSILTDEKGHRNQLSEIVVQPNKNLGLIEFPNYAPQRSEQVS